MVVETAVTPLAVAGACSPAPATPRARHCSTMENAKLGDAMIEKLRASGTAAEREKIDALGACAPARRRRRRPHRCRVCYVARASVKRLLPPPSSLPHAERLQQQALALKAEQEEKLKLVVEGETLKTVAAEAEVRWLPASPRRVPLFVAATPYRPPSPPRRSAPDGRKLRSPS